MTAERVLHEDAATARLDPLPLDPATVVDGEPQATLLPLGEVGDVEVGIWELTQGTVTDVEVDEVFVVLAGDATVRFEGGPSIELHPGSVVRLKAGDRTTWEVRSTLRKVYVTPSE
jgi:uncharacterized cupin superfamily protein